MSATSRLDILARERPEWAAWLNVLRVLVGELSDPSWEADPPHTAAPSELSPLLAGAALRPDGRALARLLRRLTDAARAQGLKAMVGDADVAQQATADDAVALFLAALNGDAAVLDAHATRTGATPAGLRTLTELLPMPYLHASARRWASAAGAGATWSQGYCPVCGAWPAFAEDRGVERARHLRCGRCGAGWKRPALTCTYCASTDHDTLATLVGGDKTARFAVDVCRHCSGYLKSFTTLQATPSDEILAADLASVEYDLAAVERGFLRPAGSGVALAARLHADGAVAPTAVRR